MKRQTTGWEKIFSNHTYDIGIVSRLDKELLKLKSKKAKQSKSSLVAKQLRISIVVSVAWVRSLAQELLHVLVVAKKKKS